MITNSPLIQLFMVILAGAIFILYIEPTMQSFRATEDKIAVYTNELNRVKEVTNLVSSHIANIDTLPVTGRQALEVYLPTTIDEIAVMRDLQTIVEGLEMEIETLEFTGGADMADGTEGVPASENTATKYPGLQTATFALSLSTSYDGVKSLLRALEMNAYQLNITAASLTPNEAGEISVVLTIETYAFRPVVTFDANASGNNAD